MAGRNFTYSFVVARSRNFVIGCENELPWRLPSDLRKFKELTIGKPIMMGRRTFESIGRALPGRLNIVISRENGLHAAGIKVVRDKQSAMALAEKDALRRGVSEIMIIGGAEIFDLFSDEVGRVYLTEIDAAPLGDAFFRRDFSSWKLTGQQYFPKSPGGDEYDFVLKTYDRPSQDSFRERADQAQEKRTLVPAE